MTFKTSSESRVVVEMPLNETTFSFETGWVAKQADGAVLVRAGETMVLVTVCTGPARQGQDFFPLVVEYQERAYAAGRIPGGFFRREGKPQESEILTARLVDRPVRPLFADNYFDEVQVICTVLSADGINSPDTLAICGAGAALHISSLPFLGPLAGVRVGRVDGRLIVNPSPFDLQKSDLDFVVAGTRDSIVMVEGGARFVPEREVLDALYFGHREIQRIIDLQEQLRAKVGKERIVVPAVSSNEGVQKRVRELVGGRLDDALRLDEKHVRRDALSALEAELQTALATEFPEGAEAITDTFHDLARDAMRSMIVKQHVRLDGRNLTTVRPIECQAGFIPRAHGSALFTRGETQAIVTTTLGTSMDAQRIDALTQQTEKYFMLHYNFPPFSTGEVKPMRGTGRREVGHGALAERALRPVLPLQNEFPYVIRIVSDITESNGSSSMASVCGGSMSLMDAGVKIKSPVAGVAMGLIKEGDEVAILTDILGDEDHFGDMDFKVCGTEVGVTALQMDIKCRGLSRETMERALDQARAGRLHILKEMAKAINETRSELSRYAPMIQTIKINPDKIRDVIGPGGKTIRSITETTGAKIDIADDGTITIASTDQGASRRAIEIIEGLTEEAEIGKVYTGVVKRITDFGAFVEIIPGVEGLVHISQLAHERVEQVSDIVREGEEVAVRVLDIDRQGRIRLSRKEAMGDNGERRSQRA